MMALKQSAWSPVVINEVGGEAKGLMMEAPTAHPPRRNEHFPHPD